MTIDNSATVSGFVGLFGVVTGGAGDLSIFNTGDIGSLADLPLVGIAADMGALASGDLLIRSDGDVYGALSGISANHEGLGDVTVDFGTLNAGSLVSGGDTGIDARITNAISTGALNINVGDGSTILGGVRGIMTRNDGVGGTTVTLGDDVMIDPDDFGVDMQGGGDQSFIAGTNLTVIVGNTDNDGDPSCASFPPICALTS